MIRGDEIRHGMPVQQHLHADEGEDQHQLYFSSGTSHQAATAKYAERRPRMAKAFEVKTMNGSRVTPRMAG